MSFWKRVVAFAERNYKLILFLYVPVFFIFILTHIFRFFFPSVFDEFVASLSVRTLNTAFVAATIVSIYLLGRQILIRNAIIARTTAALAHLDNISLWYTTYATHTVIPADAGRAASREIYRFFRGATNQLRGLFAMYTGAPCHVSIKTFDKNTGMVQTLQRDEQSPEAREEIDSVIRSFHYTRNTAFREIINNRERSFYLCNNLIEEEQQGRYDNEHKEWKSYYTATVVIPITLTRTASRINADTVLGFICIDNKHGGFEADFCKNVIFPIACLCSIALLRLSQIGREVETEAKASVAAPKAEQ